ncbi:MAG: class I SAM-dependent DNA methyltransferase, partial [Gemmatimonadaceae bacterium]|nr:class I SAM-dependent DNA methyltransferase [Gemmatimonadaceae bacterium]
MTLELPSPKDVAPKLRALAEAWKNVAANERASFQTWFLQLCDALGVPGPTTPTDAYRFELPVKVVDREGELATNFIDAWHSGHFAMEAKMSETGRQNDTLLRKAYGQVRNYASHVSGTPVPYLIVVDVPRTLMIWDRWSGSYGDFGAGKRVALASLHEREDDIALLQDIFARPAARDPRGRAQIVTTEIAARLAELAAALEDRGLDQERVARFLMRCVFSCFAEDVGLLPEQLFRKTLEAAKSSGDPARLKAALELLWKTMDEGGMFGAEMLHRFNGHFFKTREALPLEPNDVTLLIEATAFDWSRVEPSIFGTLLVRALDPEERHRLGAEYTPREYIERLVEPTVVEPIREKWVAVQATVVQLEEAGKLGDNKEGIRKKERDQAVKQLTDFHAWMRSLRFLDPACGSGNFLYVTMAAVKRVEHEVLNELARVSGGQGGLVLEEVHPRQFFGIEIKPWAREIAELTLWIGYHQFWRETHGGRTPPDPILEDTGTIECRDAILAYDAVVHRPERDRPDPSPRLVSPVTGELVPDPAAKLPYYEYVDARPAEWPEAEFIVGNPPYLGASRMRDSLGDGYTEALRSAYPQIAASSDVVGCWVEISAQSVSSGSTNRAGLITTSSITQRLNRGVIERAQAAGALVIWAAPDHPWSSEADGAAVRVAMTVLGRDASTRRLVRVDEAAAVTEVEIVARVNSDLTGRADIATASAVALKSNDGLAFAGLEPNGEGFVLSPDAARDLIRADPRLSEILKPYLNGRDVADRPRGVYAIDFGVLDEAGARRYPQLFQIVADRVRPVRAANRDRRRRELWWQFGRNNVELREAIGALSRFIVTVKTSRHRLFSFVSGVVPDSKLNCIASERGDILAVLSSSIHVHWSIAAGGRLGIGNDPTYNKESSFDAFPFPDSPSQSRAQLAVIGERLDSHRQDAIARDPRITMTKMYNVIEKLRTGEPLTPAERTIHELAACGILRDLHDQLDRLVAEAYGWAWPMQKDEILERLVALHDERAEEEKRGLIRWLRPDYQIPKFAPKQLPATLDLQDEPAPKPKRGKKVGADKAPVSTVAAKILWPTTVVDQITVISGLVALRPLDAAGVTESFVSARSDVV